MLQKRMLLIFNPKSGQQKFVQNLFQVVDLFTKAGYAVTAVPTQGANHARDLIQERGEDFDAVVCSGGDGTLNEAVDGLMLLERRPIFGYIPSGTTNDFATSLGIPKDVLEAAAVVTNGVARPLDIGKFDGEYFSYVAAFGLFTDVSYATPQSKKNVLGHLAYMLEGVKRLGSIQSYRCTVDVGEEVLSGEFILGMISNSLSVGGFKFSGDHNIKMDDGLFEVALLQKPSSFLDLQNVLVSLISQERHTDSLIVRRASRVVVTAEEPLAWTLDGEFGGEHGEISIANQHNAIEIMMPS